MTTILVLKMAVSLFSFDESNYKSSFLHQCKINPVQNFENNARALEPKK